MTDWILPLDSPLLTPAVGGGKAANLTRLLKAGFSTPAGFVITTAAYQEFVRANGLGPVISAIWERIDPANPQSYEAADKQIRTLFANGNCPSEIRSAILATYEQDIPTDVSVAVRSSATGEDMTDASFAGQHETYLGVVGRQALLSAVIKCWSSLWTARALAYRMGHRLEPDTVAMGVVVQQMLPAKMSGVLFTLDPVSGDPDEMVINATLGLGSGLAEGKLTPDTFTAARDTGDILHEKLADKAVMIRVEKGRLEEVEVAPELRRKPSLTHLHISALVMMGKQIESLFGTPQDVEWAIVRSRLYVLQSRPITASGFLSYVAPGDDAWPPLSNPVSQPFDLWTQSDLGERWPEPLTPFTWSTWQPLIERSMSAIFAPLGTAFLAQFQWVKRDFGRAYLNEGALAYALHQGYGLPATSFADGLGSVPKLAQRYRAWRWGTVLRHAPSLLKLSLGWERQIKRFAQDFATIEAWVDAFMRRDLAEDDDGALWHEAQGLWQDRLETYMRYHGAVTSTSLSAYNTMEATLRRWLGDGAALRGLVVGLTGILQAEIVPALWEMATLAAQSDLVPTLLAQDASAAFLHLRADAMAKPFLARLAGFLQRHGHRCASEAEWMRPRWVEDPVQVIAQVVTYLRSGDSFDTVGAEAQQIERRQATTRQVEARLNPFQRLYFRWALARLHRLLRMRDNGQHYLVKLALPMRRVYATLGERWAARGWLAQPDDFFFLVPAEIDAVIAEGWVAVDDLNLLRRVRERRLAWTYWMAHADFPEVLDAEGKPVAAVVPMIDGQVLTGIAASGGRVEGVARVVLSPKDAFLLRPGEILVTRATDPGWTPVFSLIGGIVLEVGGQLSHGAIVAREYGLPAVVNVLGATRRIQTGQRITVDGTAGKVFWY